MPAFRSGGVDLLWRRAAQPRHVVLCAAVFAATGVGVYLWAAGRNRSSDLAQDYTGTATVRHPAFGPAESASADGSEPAAADLAIIPGQILAADNLGRLLENAEGPAARPPGENPAAARAARISQLQRRLRVTADRTAPDRLRVSIECTDTRPENAAWLVNALAQQYAADCRAGWKDAASRAHSEARAAAQRAQQEFLSAKDRLEGFFKKTLEQAATRPVVPPRPAPKPVAPRAPVANPEWVELNRQLEDLLRWRAALLVERTEAHPAVQHVETRIDDLRQRLAQVPQWQSATASTAEEQTWGPAIPPETPEQQPAAPTGPDRLQLAAEFQALNNAMRRAELVSQRAAERERHSGQVAQQEPRIDVELAPADQPGAPAAPAASPVWASLGAGLAAAVGIGLLLIGSAIPRRLRSTAQIERLARAPVVAVIPSPIRNAQATVTAQREELARWAMVFTGTAVLVLCAAVVWIALGG